MDQYSSKRRNQLSHNSMQLDQISGIRKTNGNCVDQESQVGLCGGGVENLNNIHETMRFVSDEFQFVDPN